MSPTQNGRSTGTIPKGNQKRNGRSGGEGNRQENAEGQQQANNHSNSADNQAVNGDDLRQQSQQLERLLRNQHEKLRALEQQQAVLTQLDQFQQHQRGGPVLKLQPVTSVADVPDPSVFAANLSVLREKLHVMQNLSNRPLVSSTGDTIEEEDDRNSVSRRSQQSETAALSHETEALEERNITMQQRLAELQLMINHLDRPSMAATTSVETPRSFSVPLQAMPDSRSTTRSHSVVQGHPEELQGASEVLAAMQEQLRVQRDLQAKWRQLEADVKKDLALVRNNNGTTRSEMLQRMQRVNDWQVSPPANQQQSNNNNSRDFNGLMNNLSRSELAQLAEMIASGSTRPSNSNNISSAQNANMSESQVQLQLELLLSRDKVVQQQQDQIQQLTQSLNQCFRALLVLQRDVGLLQRTVCSLQAHSNNNGGNSSSNQSPSHQANVSSVHSQLDSVSQQRDTWSRHDFELDLDSARRAAPGGRRTSGGGNLTHHHHHLVPELHHGQSGQINNDPWNYYSSGMEVNQLAESESGVSSQGVGTSAAALNNQVPPGIRANNYWDNFRSFSRQNRLSTSNLMPSSVSGGVHPIVAQVTPRQIETNTNSDHHGHHHMPNTAVVVGRHPVMVEPYFANLSSPSRPRRKQKINREQNRESAAPNVSASSRNVMNQQQSSPMMSRPLEAAAAAMVFPMPQQEQQQRERNVNIQSRSSSLLESASHQQLMNPMVTSIKRSIYSHVNDLIAQHEQRPDQLARIFHDLQTLSLDEDEEDQAPNNPVPPPVHSTNDNNLDTSAQVSSSSVAVLRGRPWPSTLFDCNDSVGGGGGIDLDLEEDIDLVEDDDLDEEEAEDNRGGVGSSSFFKLVNKRINSGPNLPSTESAAAAERMYSGASHESSIGDSVENMFEQPLRPTAMGNDSGNLFGAVGGGNYESTSAAVKNKEETKQKNVVAVPKNVQRNLISRERDGRKVRREKPRNMVNDDDDDGGGEQEANRFVNIQLQFKKTGANAVSSEQDKQQSEMAEADQDRDEEELTAGFGAAEAAAAVSNSEIGLDRVPTRLSSSDLDTRRQEEEDSLQNLVDEVLNSSSETDFVPGDTDRLPTPQ